MFRKPIGFLWLAGLFLSTPLLVRANHPTKLPPIKIDAAVIFRFNIKVGHKYQHRPLAPWYTYFPQDPNLKAPAQPSPYPHWPQQFPPAAPAPTKDSMGYLPPSLPVPQPYSAQPYGQPAAQTTPLYRPVGWYTGPSYWYGR